MSVGTNISESTIKNKDFIDPKHVLNLKKQLVRIVYPAGRINNLDIALNTLGGVSTIQKAISFPKRPLQLFFHPTNKFNKGCTSDRNDNPGLLIKIHKNKSDPKHLEYTVVGVVVLNFTFSRLCDFQYLPVIKKENGTDKDSNSAKEVEVIYHKIVPKTLPEEDWLYKEESRNMPLFLIPPRFSNFDTAGAKLNKRTNPIDDTANANIPFYGLQNRWKRISSNYTPKSKTSFILSVNDSDIPIEPTPYIKHIFEKHGRDNDLLKAATELFDKRPIWLRTGVQYNLRTTNDKLRIILPMVAYYYNSGPWRMAWVRYGYDPRQNPESVIYQIVNYKIGKMDRIKLKMTASRQPHPIKLSIDEKSKDEIENFDESNFESDLRLNQSCYVLRPNVELPSKSIVYQLCDILLPEVEEFVVKLSKRATYCDPKYGWFTKNDGDHIRNLVNSYIIPTLQKQVREETQPPIDPTAADRPRASTSDTLRFCTEMLDSIKKGRSFYNREANPLQVPTFDENKIIYLSSDEDDENECNVRDIVSETMVEHLEEGNTDFDESVESSDELDIDLEAVQEINEYIRTFKE